MQCASRVLENLQPPSCLAAPFRGGLLELVSWCRKLKKRDAPESLVASKEMQLAGGVPEPQAPPSWLAMRGGLLELVSWCRKFKKGDAPASLPRCCAYKHGSFHSD